MKYYVIVTNAHGAEVIAASKCIESPASVILYVRGSQRREFSKRDLLFWKVCDDEASAVLCIAELGL